MTLHGFLAALLAAASCAWAGEPIRLWQAITDGAAAHPVVAHDDFDDDGRDDLAIMGEGNAPLLRIVGLDGTGEWRVKQELLLEGDEFATDLPVPYVDVDGKRKLLVLGSGGEVWFLDGWPLRVTRATQYTTHSVVRARVGDIDADGDLELLTASSAGLRILALETGQFVGSVARYGARSVELLQLDADPALEIVLSGQPGTVLDGATRAVEREHAAGFGTLLALPEGLPGASTQPLATADAAQVSLFGLTPLTPLGDIAIANAVGLAACDADGDGRDELWVLASESAELREIDTATRQVRRSLPMDGMGALFVHAIDFDGDGDCELAAGHSLDDTQADFLRIFDAGSGTLLHALAADWTPVSFVQLGDIDARPGLEQVAVFHGRRPTLRAIDAHDRGLRWTRESQASDELDLRERGLLLAQADADAPREVVLVGDAGAALVRVLDGADGHTQLAIGQRLQGPMLAREVRDAQAADLDGDGRDELLLGTVAATTTGSSGAQLHVYSLDDGSLRWESPAFGPIYQEMIAVAVAQTDGDAAVELMAVLPEGLRWYDAVSGQLEGEAPYAAGGARALRGIAGARRQRTVARARRRHRRP